MKKGLRKCARQDCLGRERKVDIYGISINNQAVARLGAKLITVPIRLKLLDIFPVRGVEKRAL